MRNPLATLAVCALTAALTGTPGLALSPAQAPVVVQGLTELQREEIRYWAAGFWSYRETGELPPGYQDWQPTALITLGASFDPFFEARILFEQVYAHRLNLNYTSPDYYTLDDLLRDDPIVLDEFRRYTITGELVTPIRGDAQALIEHMRLVTGTNPCADPDTDEEVEVWIENENLISTTILK